jgi:nitrate reductase NapD
MVISSLVVDTASEYTQAVAEELPKTPGVEVHEINQYKLVVTIEAETVQRSQAIATSFLDVTGVLSVNLVYVNFEDDHTIYPEEPGNEE